MNRADFIKLIALAPLGKGIMLPGTNTRRVRGNRLWPRYEWVTGPYLTSPSLTPSLTSRLDRSNPNPGKWKIIDEPPSYVRVCYGQLIDLDGIHAGLFELNPDFNVTIKVVNWAKSAPVDQKEAQAFLEKYAAMWPRSAHWAEGFKDSLSVTGITLQEARGFAEGIIL